MQLTADEFIPSSMAEHSSPSNEGGDEVDDFENHA